MLQIQINVLWLELEIRSLYHGPPYVLWIPHMYWIWFKSPNDITKKHRLSLVLVRLFSPATNRSLVLMPNGRLSLVTVGCEDRWGPTTTDVFCNIIWANERHVSLLLRSNQSKQILIQVYTCHSSMAADDMAISRQTLMPSWAQWDSILALVRWRYSLM